MVATSPELTAQEQGYLDLRSELKEHTKKYPPSKGMADFLIELDDIEEKTNGNKIPLINTIKSKEKEIRAYLKPEKASSKEDTSNESLMPPLPEHVKFLPEVSKGACPLRDEYIKYSEQISPEGYHDFHDGSFWFMLSTIAARRIYADFSKSLFTPLYIIFAARSSLWAKSFTASVVKDVLEAANLEWILGADRTTPQKLMSDMSGKYIPDDYVKMSQKEQEAFKLSLAMSGQVGLINDEFGKFVKGMLRQNSVMGDFAELYLTFDNCPPKYRNATIARSSEPIDRPYLTTLGCMTFASIRDNAKAGSEFWGDGFWGRFIFVTPEGEPKDEPFTRKRKPVPESLYKPLQEWHERLGHPIIDILESVDSKKHEPTGKYEKVTIETGWEETKIEVSDEAFEGWKRYRSALKKMISGFASEDLDSEDLDASYDRLPEKAMRIATLAASLQGFTEIKLCHWALAQSITETWRASLHRMYEQVNTHQQTETMDDKIIGKVQKLQDKKPPTISDIAHELHKNSTEIEPIVKALARNGKLKTVENQGKQATRYRIPEVEE